MKIDKESNLVDVNHDNLHYLLGLTGKKFCKFYAEITEGVGVKSFMIFVDGGYVQIGVKDGGFLDIKALFKEDSK